MQDIMASFLLDNWIIVEHSLALLFLVGCDLSVLYLFSSLLQLLQSLLLPLLYLLLQLLLRNQVLFLERLPVEGVLSHRQQRPMDGHPVNNNPRTGQQYRILKQLNNPYLTVFISWHRYFSGISP